MYFIIISNYIGIESVVPIVARSFLQLIQSPVRLDSQAIQSQLPETLIW
jgi:hypothetical protein